MLADNKMCLYFDAVNEGSKLRFDKYPYKCILFIITSMNNHIMIFQHGQMPNIDSEAEKSIVITVI